MAPMGAATRRCRVRLGHRLAVIRDAFGHTGADKIAPGNSALKHMYHDAYTVATVDTGGGDSEVEAKLGSLRW